MIIMGSVYHRLVADKWKNNEINVKCNNVK